MSQQTTSTRSRQWGRAVEIFSGVVMLTGVVVFTSWACLIAIDAGVI